jgi:hypothetical protein
MLNVNCLSDIVNKSYISSEIQAHLYSHASGYLVSLALDFLDVDNYINAIATYTLKTAMFFYVKIRKHPDKAGQMIQSNAIGTLISFPQLPLHLLSLESEFLHPYLKYPVSYSIGAAGDLARWYMDSHRKVK